MGGSSSTAVQTDYTRIVPDSENAAEGLGAIHRNPDKPDKLLSYYYDDAKTLYEVFQ